MSKNSAFQVSEVHNHIAGKTSSSIVPSKPAARRSARKVKHYQTVELVLSEETLTLLDALVRAEKHTDTQVTRSKVCERLIQQSYRTFKTPKMSKRNPRDYRTPDMFMSLLQDLENE